MIPCWNCRPSWLICVTWADPGDAKWLVSVELELGCWVGTEVTPATHIEGGGYQVQGPPLLERGESEHPTRESRIDRF